MTDRAVLGKILVQLLAERRWAKFFSSAFNTPFNPPAVYIHREYQQRDSKIPKGYRWRMHNRACGITQPLVEAQGHEIWVRQPPRIQKAPHLAYLKDKETVKL